MPFVIVVHFALLVWAYYVLLHYPITHFGFVYTSLVYGTLFLAALLCLFYPAINKEAHTARKLSHLKERAALAVDNPEVVIEEKTEETEEGPGFFLVVWSFFVAVKEKTCPIIEFEQNDMKGEA